MTVQSNTFLRNVEQIFPCSLDSLSREEQIKEKGDCFYHMLQIVK